MSFRVAAKTLERLEWAELLVQLARHLRTPQSRRQLEETPESLFEATAAGAEARLRETGQALAILQEDDLPPLTGVGELEPLLQRLTRGGVLQGEELVALGATLDATHQTARFLQQRAESAPALAEIGELLVGWESLAREIDRALESDGQVRDSASSELANSRREVRSISGKAQEKIESMLRRPELRAELQDNYFTVRSERFVLPVKAEARSRVPGIVHDASATGTTVFIEPQALVDLNNRLKQAELTVIRETHRVLQQLSSAAAAACDDVASNLQLLAQIDLAFARACLAREQEAVEPILDENGDFDLPLLRHPLLPADEAIPNDVRLGGAQHVLVISGANAGGKTVTMKAIALAALLARAGLFVPAGAGARIGAVDEVLADIGDEQDIRQSLSTFSAHMANLSRIVEQAGPRSLVVLDEIGVGTDPGEGAALAQAVLERLADAGARVVTTTHYNLLKEMANVDDRFENACVEFDEETLAPTYRLKLGTPGSSSATAVASRMGMPNEVLERANHLLDREDRRLDKMLAELSNHRAALERERAEASRLRAESESERARYQEKLERLQERRDQLFDSMRSELDEAFQQAHGEVAGVIRDLQRGGSAQEAARARKRLLELEKKARAKEDGQRERAPEAPRRHVDWNRARPGDPVRMPGGRAGTLQTLPDRRGRVTVQAGSARLTLRADQVEPATADALPKKQAPRIRADPPAAGGEARIDVRGLRVDEALSRVEEGLDQAARRGAPQLDILHGIGSGALRGAIREHLARLGHVARFHAADPAEGGEGVTRAHLDG
ncbi:MAG: endonuclease MutS2 [Deltaproteobacteria bacterium]|nr:endonuclease MutS2 [Deltaproteobacteria bacterium]